MAKGILHANGIKKLKSLSGEDTQLSPPLEQADRSKRGFFCYCYNDKIPNLKSPKEACDYVSDFGMRCFYVKA